MASSVDDREPEAPKRKKEKNRKPAGSDFVPPFILVCRRWDMRLTGPGDVDTPFRQQRLKAWQFVTPLFPLPHTLQVTYNTPL